jgi:hypothetical protein
VSVVGDLRLAFQPFGFMQMFSARWHGECLQNVKFARHATAGRTRRFIK